MSDSAKRDRRTLTHSRVKELLHYDPHTGEFVRRITTAPRSKAGERPGGIDGRGYWRLSVDGERYYAHQLAWLYVYGHFPPQGMEIDHINHNRADNRLANLRLVSRPENQRNCTLRVTNSSGCYGVSWDAPSQKWRVRVWRNGKDISLGYFEDYDEAVNERKAANRRYGFSPNHGIARLEGE